MPKHRDLTASPTVIVIVDDDAAVRKSLKFSLEIEGFSVRAFSDGRELLDQKEFPSCGCLIVDQNMPDMQGIDLIAVLRQRHISAPAILITSHPSAALKARAANDGVPIVEKPLLGSALIDAIRSEMTRPSTPLHS